MYVKLISLKVNAISDATTKCKQSLALPAFFNSKDSKKIHALVPTVYFVLACFHFTVAENSSPSSESQTLLPAATFSQLLL